MAGPELLTIGLIIGGLCLGGLVLSFLLPIFSGIFTIVTAVLEVGIDVLTGGPVAWCGCLVLLILIVGCLGLVAIVAFTLPTCGTPDAVNFCSWFGL